MTRSRADELELREAGPVRKPKTLAEALAAMLIVAADDQMPAPTDGITFPAIQFQTDPAAFAYFILGVALAPHQIEIAEAVRDNKRVAVASGHKVGKSLTMAFLSLWYFCSFVSARAIMTSTTDRQVNAILWRELRMLLHFSGWCLDCKRSNPEHYRRDIPRPCPHSAIIDYTGDVPEMARTGLHSKDFREIVGFTAREAEAVAGISGPNLLYLVDEASGVASQIFAAIRGNMMGGARILMSSNPTRTEGDFFEAFEKVDDTGKLIWKTFQISSEMVAELGIPGLASKDEIAELRREYGPDSPFYWVRVLGKFAIGEEGKVITLDLITQAQERWKETPAVGRLHIGIDCAGESGTGDESVFAPRIGQKVFDLYCRRGLTAEAHLVELLGMLGRYRAMSDGGVPVVKVDRDGEVGAKVYSRLVEYVETHPDVFVLIGVRGGWRRSADKYRMYDTTRDEVWGSGKDWLKAGGAIPSDVKLAKELHAPDASPDAANKMKITPKKELREALGRSPDRADAVLLSIWDPGGVDEGGENVNAKADGGGIAEPEESSVMGLDPYIGADWTRRR